mmetsp:Transcript_95879/g.293269  ORF Transcript_95879/g.293269 Transcript_95879/m.293269 type:complete len:211 (-) Transcript_95879:255-887(-)
MSTHVPVSWSQTFSSCRPRYAAGICPSPRTTCVVPPTTPPTVSATPPAKPTPTPLRKPSAPSERAPITGAPMAVARPEAMPAPAVFKPRARPSPASRGLVCAKKSAAAASPSSGRAAPAGAAPAAGSPTARYSAAVGGLQKGTSFGTLRRTPSSVPTHRQLASPAETSWSLSILGAWLSSVFKFAGGTPTVHVKLAGPMCLARAIDKYRV